MQKAIILVEKLLRPYWADECLDWGDTAQSTKLLAPLIEGAFGSTEGLLIGSNTGDSRARITKKPTLSTTFDIQPPKTATSFTHRVVNEGKYGRILVQGQLREKQRHALQSLLESIRARPTTELEIDLLLCDVITVTGVGILLLIKEAIGAPKAQISLKNCQPKVAETLRWAGMEKYFLIEQRLDSNNAN